MEPYGGPNIIRGPLKPSKSSSICLTSKNPQNLHSNLPQKRPLLQKGGWWRNASIISLDPLGLAKNKPNTLENQPLTVVQKHSSKEYDQNPCCPLTENATSFKSDRSLLWMIWHMKNFTVLGIFNLYNKVKTEPLEGKGFTKHQERRLQDKGQ